MLLIVFWGLDKVRVCPNFSGLEFCLLVLVSLLPPIFPLLLGLAYLLLLLLLDLLPRLVNLLQIPLQILHIVAGKLSLFLAVGLKLRLRFRFVLQRLDVTAEDIIDGLAEVVLVLVVLLRGQLRFDHKFSVLVLPFLDVLDFAALVLDECLLQLGLAVLFRLPLRLLQLFDRPLLLLSREMQLVEHFPSPLENRADFSLAEHLQVVEQVIQILRPIFDQVVVFLPLLQSGGDLIMLREDEQRGLSLDEFRQRHLSVEMHRRVVLVASSLSALLEQSIDARYFSGQLLVEVVRLGILEHEFGVK